VFGPQPGGYVGTCLLALATVWSVISALDLWESDLSLNFPVNVNDSLSHAQLITSLKGIAHNALLVSIHSHSLFCVVIVRHTTRIGLRSVHQRGDAALAVQVYLLPAVPPYHAPPLQEPVRHQVPLSVPLGTISLSRSFITQFVTLTGMCVRSFSDSVRQSQVRIDTVSFADLCGGHRRLHFPLLVGLL
jgi:hypothetical protein